LFQTPSGNFLKTAQSKLWDKPGYEFYKAASRLWGLLKYYSNTSPNLTISIDNETNAATNTSTFNPLTITLFNNAGGVITLTNNSSAIIILYSSGTGFTVIPAESIGQSGALIGLTVQTHAADMAIVSMKIGSDNMAGRW
jgi:hypothetical protein